MVTIHYIVLVGSFLTKDYFVGSVFASVYCSMNTDIP